MNLEGTLVITMDRKTGEEISRELINLRPATQTYEEYLMPAAEYLAYLLSEQTKTTC